MLASLPFWAGDYWTRIWTGVAMWAGLAASWNIIGGYAGYISFGQVAFFGIGAYATAILMQPSIHWNFFLTLPVGAVVASIFALVVGWPGLAAVGKVVRMRETAAKTTTETAYYLLSSAMTPQWFGDVVRSHCAIENRLHWCLDVSMNDDQMRTRLGNGPQNLAVLRNMALNLARKETSKGSLPKKHHRAA